MRSSLIVGRFSRHRNKILLHGMRTVLICHHDEALNRVLMPRWLASFSDLRGIILIEEPRQVLRRRIRREIKRVGLLRFLDVLAFRIHYALFHAHKDHDWEQAFLNKELDRYPELPEAIPVLRTENPNEERIADFLRNNEPDIILARCKSLLKRSIYSTAKHGTFVLHPGICPEYRNAHGCFWALAERDLQKVGATLLRIDDGIDTGPSYQTFSVSFDEVEESHIRIQSRVVFENLQTIQESLVNIVNGNLHAINTTGRESNNWGQPWLSRWLRWKRAAQRARRQHP
jgi:folate-dependent phosphoribosylglycinamide formyltransferase PurN